MSIDITTNPASATASTLSLLVRQIRYEATGINSYELVDPQGDDLPAFTAGAHLDIHIKPGLIRQYSLCNDPTDRKRYVIAVLKAESGLGGSKALHDTLRVQDLVKVSVPRNHFPLKPDAEKIVLLAGGIGITPLKAMIHTLDKASLDYQLHYCARDASCAAFTDTFADHAKVHVHYDNGDPAQGLDIAALLAAPDDGTHVYFCGPPGFMQACLQATQGWPAGTVHCEYFKAPVAERTDKAQTSETDGSFKVKIASTGQQIGVPADKSLIEALSEAGIELETSCVSGLCGTCKIRYLEGEVDHQDYILSPDEQSEYLTACVSRAKSELLVLDL